MTLEEKKENLPYVVHQTKYLKFVLVKFKSKTKVYAVVSVNHGDELGRIEWFSRWRQYCFMPHGMTVWNIGCLNDIQKFLDVLMISRKPKPKTIGVVCKDYPDFQYWSQQKKHRKKTGGKINMYVVGTTTYRALSNPNHCHGLLLDKIVETYSAKLNPNYHTIMRDVEICLRRQI